MSDHWLFQLTPENLKRALQIATALRPIADACCAEGLTLEEMIRNDFVNVALQAEVDSHIPYASELDLCQTVGVESMDSGEHRGEGTNTHASNALPFESPATRRKDLDDEDENESAKPFADVPLECPSTQNRGEPEATPHNEFDDETEDKFTQPLTHLMPMPKFQHLPTELTDLVPSACCPSDFASEEVKEVTPAFRKLWSARCGKAKPSQNLLDSEVGARCSAVTAVRSSASAVWHSRDLWQ